MDNARVAQALNSIAVLLEIKGEDPFVVTYYASASQVVGKLSEPVALLFQESRLRNLEGIGEELEKKIGELLTTGEMGFLNELRQMYPPTILDLLRVDGLGPRSIKVLFEALKIGSLTELYQACVENKVAQIAGFSSSSEQKFLLSLEFLASQKGHFRLNNAWVAAAPLSARLREHSPALSVEVAGSLRRFNNLVRNANLVAASTDPVPVMKCFVNAPEVEQVLEAGRARSAVTVKGGITVDLHVVTPLQFPYALLHFTGSRKHIAMLRKRADEQGLELNEYGLFKKDGTPVICNNEADIYAALHLPFLAPELREGTFEFTLTDPVNLLDTANMQGLVHCHSAWSDGTNTLNEMADAARQLGYQYLVVTDHSRSSAYVNGLTPERVMQQHAAIDEINALELSGFRVLKGIESDILADGSLDYDPDVLRSFEFIIASVHANFDMTEKEATWRIIRAMEDPFTSAIGHLTGRLLLTRRGYKVNIEKVVDAAVANGVAIEINANPRRLDMDWRHLYRAAEKGVRFVIGPDAHNISGLNNMRYGIGIARKGALSPEHILNCLPVEEFLQWRKS